MKLSLLPLRVTALKNFHPCFFYRKWTKLTAECSWRYLAFETSGLTYHFEQMTDLSACSYNLFNRSHRPTKIDKVKQKVNNNSSHFINNNFINLRDIFLK